MSISPAKKARVCLVEPQHSHEEVLFPLIELLREKCDLCVIAPHSLLAVDLLSRTSHLYRARGFTPDSGKGASGRLLGRFRSYCAIRGAVRDEGPDLVIFNSTYSLADAALLACLFRAQKKIQIIHNLQQFLAPGMGLLYRAFDANLVISEQVHKYVTGRHSEFSDLDYVLPIFFDGFLPGCPDRAHKGAHPCCLKLGVFGTIEDSRRNYSGLLNAVRAIAQDNEAPGFKIHLVGRAPAEIQAYIAEHRLEKVISYFTKFVPFSEMFQLLADMDIVLFLIDGEVRNAKHYNKYKISGTSTLMKAFKKAGAASTDFAVDDSLADKCFQYPGSDIGSLLRLIAAGGITAEQVYAKEALYRADGEFSFAHQQERLLSLVQRVMAQSP